MSKTGFNHTETKVLTEGTAVILVMPATTETFNKKLVEISDRDGETYTVHPKLLQRVPIGFFTVQEDEYIF